MAPSQRIEINERFERMIRFFEGVGALDRSVQIGWEELSERTGLPRRTLSAHTKRAEQLGILKIRRPAQWGVGRMRNEYRLTMSWERWMQRAPKVIAKLPKGHNANTVRDRQAAVKLAAEAEATVAREMAEREGRTADPATAVLLDDDDLLDGW